MRARSRTSSNVALIRPHNQASVGRAALEVQVPALVVGEAAGDAPASEVDELVDGKQVQGKGAVRAGGREQPPVGTEGDAEGRLSPSRVSSCRPVSRSHNLAASSSPAVARLEGVDVPERHTPVRLADRALPPVRAEHHRARRRVLEVDAAQRRGGVGIPKPGRATSTLPVARNGPSGLKATSLVRCRHGRRA
jgi:hypothetical protein